MQKTISYTYEIPTERYWKDLYFNQQFTEQLYVQGLSCVHFQVLAEGSFPDYSRTIQSQPKLTIPKTLQKILGSSLSYTEKGHLLLTDNEYRFEIIPSTLANKISISGVHRIRSLGPTETESTITIDFNVHMFGIGKIVEKFILQSTIDNQQKAAAFMKQWLQEKS